MNDERPEPVRAVDSGDVIVPEFVSMFCSMCKEPKAVSIYDVVFDGHYGLFKCPDCKTETKVMA